MIGEQLWAMFIGGVLAMLLAVPLVRFCWHRLALLAPGPVLLRPAMACLAAYGVMAAAGLVVLASTQPQHALDEGMLSLLFVGALVLAIGFLVLWRVAQKARRA